MVVEDVLAGASAMARFAFTAPRDLVLMRREFRRTEPRRAGAPEAVGLRLAEPALSPSVVLASSGSCIMSAAAATSWAKTNSMLARQEKGRNLYARRPFRGLYCAFQ